MSSSFTSPLSAMFQHPSVVKSAPLANVVLDTQRVNLTHNTVTDAAVSNNSAADDYFEVNNLAVSFDDTDVVKDLSLQLKRGEIGCLLGFSGCGKTTALRAIAGLELPKQGLVRLNGKTITHANNNTLLTNIAPAKRGMGMVFQDYALFTHLSVSENIGFGLHRWSKAERQARITEMLELVDLSDHANKRISELSGGQQQRIALARALAPKPELLLLDEPFSNLDMMLRESLAAKVRDILKRTNTTAILVTHDQHEAFAIADKIGVMHEGGIAQWGGADTLYHKPVNPFVAEFIGESAMIKGVMQDGVIKTAIGDIPCQGIAVHDEQNINEMHDSVDGAHSHQFGEKIERQINRQNDAQINRQIDSNPCLYHATIDTPFKVLIRPDDIVHDDNSPLKAKVIGRVFRGANFLYHLQLNNGEEILSLIPSHHDHAIGTHIGYRPILAHVILFTKGATDSDDWQRIWL